MVSGQLLISLIYHKISDAESTSDYSIVEFGRMNYFFSRKLRKDAKEAEKTLYRNGQKKIAAGSLGIAGGVLGILGFLGVILAPVTFGASLTLTTVSAASAVIAIPSIALTMSEERDRTEEFLRNQNEMIQSVQNKSSKILELLIGKP